MIDKRRFAEPPLSLRAVLRTAANRVALLLFICLLTTDAHAQPSIDAIPPVERHADDFYHAIAGTKAVQAEWTAQPMRVPLDGDITLTLTIRHAANPVELLRPDLRKRTEYTDRFQITDEPTTTGPDEVRHVYRLRPRSVGEVEIPSLKYRYYRPGFPPGKRMQTTYAPAVKVTVTPPPPKPAEPPRPIEAPSEFFEIDSNIDDQCLKPIMPSSHDWIYPILIALWCAIVPAFLWRWFFPNAARRARLRQHRAARIALKRLRTPAANDPAVAVTVLRDYLASRWGDDTTTAPPELADILRDCDEARFAPDSDIGPSLAQRITSFIETWEEVSR